MRKPLLQLTPDILALPVTDIMHVKQVIDNEVKLQEFMDNRRLMKYERYRRKMKQKQNLKTTKE